MPVSIERQGVVGIVILDWPERRNAMGPDECRELSAVLDALAADRDVLGVVVTGNGAFCAGGDLKGSLTRSDMPPEERRRVVYGAYQGMIRSLIALPVPTVAAIDGAAVGMGLDIALACDSRFIGSDGWAMQGWGRVGLVPGTGGEWFLRLRAPGLLWSLLETQPRIHAAMARELGIAEAAEGSARDRAIQRIERLAEMGRPALEAYVALARLDLRAGLDAHLAAAVERQIDLLADPAFGRKVGATLGR